MFVVFVLALSKDRILIMYFALFQPCITDAHRCIDVYAAAVHLYDWETPDFSPLLPLILPLFLFCCRSVNCKLFFDLFFVVSSWWQTTTNLELKILESSENSPRWHAVLSALTVARWWSTGRAETSRHCGVRRALLVLVRLELSWLFGLRSLLPPSPFGF